MTTSQQRHALVVHGDYAYTIGGEFGNESLERLHKTKLDKWEEISEMKEIRLNCPAVLHGDNIYVISGNYPNQMYSTKFSVEIYDIKNNKGGKSTTMRQSQTYHSAVVVGDKIYVMGGQDESFLELQSTEVFDTITKIWLSSPDMPKPLSNFNAVAVGKFIFEKGYKHYDASMVSFVFDVDLYQWIHIQNNLMNQPQYYHAAVVLEKDDTLFAFGGARGTIPLDSVKYVKFGKLTRGIFLDSPPINDIQYHKKK